MGVIRVGLGTDRNAHLPSLDRALSSLIEDLSLRGMLDDTLIICGGEFGRTIYSQGKLSKNNHGRDHHGEHRKPDGRRVPTSIERAGARLHPTLIHFPS